MDDASGAAGGSGGEVALLDDENALASARALVADHGPVDSSANHDYVEALVMERRPFRSVPCHVSLMHLFVAMIEERGPRH